VCDSLVKVLIVSLPFVLPDTHFYQFTGSCGWVCSDCTLGFVIQEEHATSVLGLKELSPYFIVICSELLDSPISWSSCLSGLWHQLGLKSFNIEDRQKHKC
jgi:hypothetical protein